MLGLKRKKDAPPDAEHVLGRARILSMRVVHSMTWPPPDMLPELMAPWSEADRASFADKYAEACRDIRSSLEANDLWAQTSPAEREVFSVPLVERTMRQLIDSSWAVESIACCLWALSVLPAIAPYDQEHEPQATVKQVPKSADGLSLRSSEELEVARSLAELWHWRARTRQLLEAGHPLPLPDGLTIDEVVRMTAELAAEGREGGKPINGDFPAFGKPYRELTPEEYQHVTSIAMERHKALNWICGLAPKNQWELTPTDT